MHGIAALHSQGGRLALSLFRSPAGEDGDITNAPALLVSVPVPVPLLPLSAIPPNADADADAEPSPDPGIRASLQQTERLPFDTVVTKPGGLTLTPVLRLSPSRGCSDEEDGEGLATGPGNRAQNLTVP